jgi:chemotaxis protein CheD
MQTLIVGVADCQVSVNPDCALVTYALGSCVGVAIYDPVARVAGLLHLMLPDSAIDPAQAGTRPYMFADTGVPLLFRRAYALGADKRRIGVRLVGGAQVMDDHGVFDIGRRNYLAARKILWKAGVLIQGEAVGGTTSRTVRLEVATGTMWLRGADGIEQEFRVPSPGPKGISYGFPRSDRG